MAKLFYNILYVREKLTYGKLFILTIWYYFKMVYMQHFLWDDYILFIGKTNSYVCNEWFKGIPGVELRLGFVFIKQ